MRRSRPVAPSTCRWRSISVDTPVAKLTDELKSDQWLDAKKYPQITFKATSVTVTGPGEAKVTGDFTLHGVTKPLTLTAKLVGGGANPITKKYNVGFELSGKISSQRLRREDLCSADR